MSCLSFGVFPVCVLRYTNHMLGMGWVTPSDSTPRALWGSLHLPNIGILARFCENAVFMMLFFFSMSKKWVCLKMLAKPLNPMVLLIIIPMKNGYFIGKINPTFSGPNPSGDVAPWKVRNKDLLCRQAPRSPPSNLNAWVRYLTWAYRHEWQPNIHGAFPMEDLQIIQNSTHFCIETYGFWICPDCRKPPWYWSSILKGLKSLPLMNLPALQE